MRYAIGFFITALLFLGGIFFWQSLTIPQHWTANKIPPTQAPVKLSSAKLTALVNTWRVSQGFQSYVIDERLCTIAQDRANEQYALGTLDEHKGFYQKYSNYPYVIQENAALNNQNEQQTLTQWLQSPAHHATLVKPYRYTCIACQGNICDQIFSSFLKS